MIKKLLTASAVALALMAGSQTASAATVSPEIHNKAPATSTALPAGSYKVADRRRRGGRDRGRRGSRVGTGFAIGLGALALGAAAAAAADDRRYRGRSSCRRVERRCARRHGWETRRWFNCVEDRGC